MISPFPAKVISLLLLLELDYFLTKYFAFYLLTLKCLKGEFVRGTNSAIFSFASIIFSL